MLLLPVLVVVRLDSVLKTEEAVHGSEQCLSPKPVALVAETSKQTVVETQLPHRTKLEARVLKQQWLQPSSSLLSLPLFYQPVTTHH